jgi:hypothetical protein
LHRLRRGLQSSPEVGCCNANPDPCCVVSCGAPMTPECQAEKACQGAGGDYSEFGQCIGAVADAMPDEYVPTLPLGCCNANGDPCCPFSYCDAGITPHSRASTRAGGTRVRKRASHLRSSMRRARRTRAPTRAPTRRGTTLPTAMRTIALPSPDLAPYLHPERRIEAFYFAVERFVIPRLHALGLDGSRAWAWRCRRTGP